MKAITIWLPDVEAAMLVEVQKKNKDFRDLQRMILQEIRNEHKTLQIKQ